MQIRRGEDGTSFVIGGLAEADLFTFQVGLSGTLTALEDWEFATRTGVERDEMQVVLDELLRSTSSPQTDGPPHAGESMRLARSDEGIVTITGLVVSDLIAIKAGMRETLEVVREAKFVDRTGMKREEMQAILREFVLARKLLERSEWAGA